MHDLDPDLVRQLPPAFATGALFLLVIGGGAVAMARLRVRAQGDFDNAIIRQGFRRTGIVALIFAVALFLTALKWFQTLGPWFHLIPAAAFIDGLMFLSAARKFHEPRASTRQ